MTLRTIGEDILEVRRGGGCFFTVFGTPFLLAGLFVIGLSIGLIRGVENPPPLYFGLQFGFVFAAVGAGLIFGRSGIVINRVDRKITTWWGLLVPFRSKEHPLDDYDQVTLSREVRRSKNSTYTVYPVRIAGEGKPITVETPQSYEQARKTAEQLAKFLRFPLADSSSGAEVVRAPDELDRSLRERIREMPEMPEPPSGLRTKCGIEGDRVILDFPPAGFGIGQVIAILAGVGFPVFVCFTLLGPILDNVDMPPNAKMVFVAFVGFFFVLLPLAGGVGGAIFSARRRERVVASRESLRVEKIGPLGRKAVEIPADELEELVLPDAAQTEAALKAIEQVKLPEGAKRILTTIAAHRTRALTGIQARSDRAVVEFGSGLPPEELRWIHAVVLRMLTA